MRGVELITAPTDKPLTIEEVAAHLAIDPGVNDFDSQVGGLIDAATSQFETILNRQILSAQYRFTFDEFPIHGDSLWIPRSPLVSVSLFEYLDSAENWQTWDSANYIVDGTREPGRVFPVYGGTWPDGAIKREASVRLTTTNGYGARADVSWGVKLCLLTMIADWWTGRAGENEIGESARRLLASYRVGDTYTWSG